MRLRKWVKVSLVMVTLVMTILFANNYTNKAIDKCVSAGHDKTYCEMNLR